MCFAKIISFFTTLISRLFLFVLLLILIPLIIFILLVMILLSLISPLKTSIFTIVKRRQDQTDALRKKYFDAQQVCTVTLISVPEGQKIQVIRLLREHTDWDITQAKDFVEGSLPAVIHTQMPVDVAQSLQRQLKEYGVMVEIQ